jgi:RNA recognition motif-containing protein
MNYSEISGKKIRLMWNDKNQARDKKANLIVKNLPESTTHKDFLEKFQQYGNIQSAKVFKLCNFSLSQNKMDHVRELGTFNLRM